ncbi:MAG: DEAD/DEAH box helicase [Oscillibacter ruminantium]|uniref:DEAD/DEAH box helicase n=1 Tax=Oscillibacter ruminantium TaxID=1263547 RepID=UPI002B202A17|nr:DEAD/DEAH box helicase [Oscillibacter ruminantium]MEA5042868.1 DEAD/DEAH box helicase [Oscillibacter ruminantium]
MTFKELNLTAPILKAIDRQNYTTPTPIQQKAIPFLLQKRDLIGCAQTGTGKTAAFALPILQNLASERGKFIKALILTPTRELAIQIQENFEDYGSNLSLRCTVIFGGVSQVPQVERLQRGTDILIATPGRLCDLMNQGYVDISQIQIFVLDEADRMLDMGFIHDVKKVLRALPKNRQTLLFSATMPTEIEALAKTILHDPVTVKVDPVTSTAASVQQYVYLIDKGNKRHLLKKLLRARDVGSALVFTRTKHAADKVVKELAKAGMVAMAIHGNKGQTARQTALKRFKSGDIKILVATDIAARGIDIPELSHVFNYELPNEPETYIHRIGRTGRAGLGGIAVSFCDYDEIPYLKDIEKLMGHTVPVEKSDWPMMILEKSEKTPQKRYGAGRAHTTAAVKPKRSRASGHKGPGVT